MQQQVDLLCSSTQGSVKGFTAISQSLHFFVIMLREVQLMIKEHPILAWINRAWQLSSWECAKNQDLLCIDV